MNNREVVRYGGVFLTALALTLMPGLLGHADTVEQGPKDSKPSGLLAGVARADITPARRHRANELGFANPHRISRG